MRRVTNIKVAAVTLCASVQVCQTATADALTKAYPIVDHGEIEALFIGLDLHPNMRGLRVFCNVSERLPQHSLHVSDDRVIGNRVQRPNELQVWTDWQQRRELINDRKCNATQRWRRILMKGENRAPDLPDRLVKLFHGMTEALIDCIVVYRSGNALQAEPSSEQPLDHMIM